MKPTGHNANAASTSKTGLFAPLGALPGVSGIGAALRRSVPAVLMVGCAALGGLVFTSAPALAEGACPNEALRTELSSGELPDCRAYEMVSPPYKEGYPMYVPPGGFAASGEKAILYSLADLAGSEGAGESAIEGSLYLDTRATIGWQLSPLNAPLSQFVGQIPVAVEATSGETLWKQHTPGQSAFNRGLYARSATGVFSLIGPLSLPAEGKEEGSNVIESHEVHYDRPVAATRSYGHIILFAPASDDYWPFDSTAGNNGSLYEYSGTNNSEPILVGVKGPKDNTELIGSCGTALGGKEAVYNALSASGEVVFFTVLPCGEDPKSAEVYARWHGSLVSPVAASEVDLSANECTVACGSEESGKHFEGASETGERVFFTSTQKLTNNAVDSTTNGNAAGARGCSTFAVGAGGCNLYEYHFKNVEDPEPRGELRLVEGGEVLGVAGISENGARIYYVSRQQVPGAGVNELHQGPTAEQPNLYVYETNNSVTKFIATLRTQDEDVWSKTFAERPVEMTGSEGQFLLFASSTPDLTADDTRSLEQLFEYDAETGELVRVTKGEDGYSENGNGVTTGIENRSISLRAGHLGGSEDFKSLSDRLNMSADGKTVFFETVGGLSPRAVSAEDGCSNVYEFRWDNVPSDGVVSLVSDGRDTQLYKGAVCGAQFLATDASGADVLFTTADPLVPADTDGYQRDVYDAREDGGFSVVPTGTAACEGVGCEGSATTPPSVFGSPSSATLTGSGNLALPPLPVTATAPKKTTKKTVKCPKGKKPSHGKCGKARTKTKTSKAKKTSLNRRAR